MEEGPAVTLAHAHGNVAAQGTLGLLCWGCEPGSSAQDWGLKGWDVMGRHHRAPLPSDLRSGSAHGWGVGGKEGGEWDPCEAISGWRAPLQVASPCSVLQLCHCPGVWDDALVTACSQGLLVTHTMQMTLHK